MEGFFIASGTLEVVSAEELLLSRYHNMDYIMALEFEEGIDFLNKAEEKELDRIAWDLYIAQYPYMNEENFVTFNEFKERFSVQAPMIQRVGKTAVPETKLSDSELIEELSRINTAGKEAAD